MNKTELAAAIVAAGGTAPDKATKTQLETLLAELDTPLGSPAPPVASEASEAAVNEALEAALVLAAQPGAKDAAKAFVAAGSKPTRFKVTDDELRTLIGALLGANPGLSKSAAEMVNYQLLGASVGQGRWYKLMAEVVAA